MNPDMKIGIGFASILIGISPQLVAMTLVMLSASPIQNLTINGSTLALLCIPSLILVAVGMRFILSAILQMQEKD